MIILRKIKRDTASRKQGENCGRGGRRGKRRRKREGGKGREANRNGS